MDSAMSVAPLFHVSDANGFLCANCGNFMKPPHVLSCGHSVCHQCSQGCWGDAARLMREVHCRPCKKSELQPGFLEPPTNKALQVALWKAIDFKDFMEDQLKTLQGQVHDLQSSLARAEMEVRRKTQETASLHAELMAFRCKIPPPPLPPRLPLAPPTPPVLQLQNPLLAFQSQLRHLAQMNGLLPMK